jgi:ketosteroid isomerase-like protein
LRQSHRQIKKENRMYARDPGQAIKLIDIAFQDADIDALVSLYDDAAVLTSTELVPGREIRGKQELRDFYSGVLKPGAFSVAQVNTHMVEADGIALFTSRWSLSRDGSPTKSFVATVVFRRQPDGGWKDLIDSSPAVLGKFWQADEARPDHRRMVDSYGFDVQKKDRSAGGPEQKTRRMPYEQTKDRKDRADLGNVIIDRGRHQPDNVDHVGSRKQLGREKTVGHYCCLGATAFESRGSAGRRP